MKDCFQSSGPDESLSSEPSNGISTETIETVQSKTEETNGANGSGTIETIDPNHNSYFIQYHPEIAEKLSKHNSTYSVSGRCLSIVMSRMLYWSRYAKHRFQGKLWYWKNQTELGEETGFSIKQINRALKVLVELGLLVREKFQKHYYRQVYFYHVPSSPHTKEVKQTTRSTTRSTSTGSGGLHQQQRFHGAPGGAAARRPESVVVTSTPVAFGAPGGAPGGSGATKTTSKIDQSKESRSTGTKCPNQTQENQSLIKQSLLNIIEKCNSYGQKDIYKEKFTWAIGD